MENMIIQSFHANPSALGTLLKAFASRKNVFTGKEAVPIIRIVRKNVLIGDDQVAIFNNICGLTDLSSAPALNPLYPLTIAYPYIMRILCRRDVPVNLFKVLNTVSSVTMLRPLQTDESVELTCSISDLRTGPKGLEIDISSEITAAGLKAWENVMTYLLRGKIKNSGNKDKFFSSSLEPIPGAPVIAKWFLPAKDRFRFARLSGDTNGIHYCQTYARMYGFERDFSQPIRVAARCVAELALPENDGPLRLHFLLKGPVYYERYLTLRSVEIDRGRRFDLYCEGNERPCITGQVQRI